MVSKRQYEMWPPASEQERLPSEGRMNTKIEIDCLNCKSKFLAFPSDIKRNKKFCSSHCYHTNSKGKSTSLLGKSAEQIYGIERAIKVRAAISAAVKAGKVGFKKGHQAFGGFKTRFKKGIIPRNKGKTYSNLKMKGELNPMWKGPINKTCPECSKEFTVMRDKKRTKFCSPHQLIKMQIFILEQIQNPLLFFRPIPNF